MELSHARKLIVQGEGETIEFKRKVAHPDKIVKELVAFANTSGGNLFVGVSDDGTIPGLKFPEDEIFALNQAIDRYCQPEIKYEYEIIPLTEKKSLVRYFIPTNQGRLYQVNLDRPRRTTYVRHGDKSIKASREVKEIFRRRLKNKNVQFHFGEKEKVLMEHLEKEGVITLNQFQKKAQLNYFKASKTLVLLVLANVLKVIPSDKGDEYYLKK